MQENLNLYYVFYVVAKHLNITEAAKRLFISQPAVSKSISKLEENLNIQLFLRSSKGVSLTYEGELLFKKLSTAFESIEQGEMQLKNLTKYSVGHISIGVSNTLCKYVLLPYLKKFKEEYPHIGISISCQSSSDTLKAIDNGSVDIGLISQIKDNKKYSFHAFQEIKDIFVATPAYLKSIHELYGEEVDLTKVANFLLLDKANMTRQYIDRYMSENNMQFDNIMEVSSMDLLIDFAKTDLGIASVIESFVSKELEEGSLVRIPFIEDVIPRNIGFVYLEDMPATKAISSFMEHINVYKD